MLSNVHVFIENYVVYETHKMYSINFFFSVWIFFHDHSRFTGLHWKGEGISVTPLYHLHPLHIHLEAVWAIIAESSPLAIASG